MIKVDYREIRCSPLQGNPQVTPCNKLMGNYWKQISLQIYPEIVTNFFSNYFYQELILKQERTKQDSHKISAKNLNKGGVACAVWLYLSCHLLILDMDGVWRQISKYLNYDRTCEESARGQERERSSYLGRGRNKNNTSSLFLEILYMKCN